MEHHNTNNILRRLNIAEGQIRGLRELISNGAYCIDVITQTSAIKQALSGVEDMLLESHLSACVVDQMKKGNEKKAVEEMIKVYKLKRR
ncbi:hypothetical protein A3C17_01065 [Candidatus Uhrbacteria bacterium RIFCSPHIGHO2_02_FULL_53_13]|uniref:Transcriptional regulator n=2 Tax=Candidatus Uhriibacteriota TaxID=1752732 RepID=A0A1F7U124_9BACT|nr:MAG: hypothetical protein A3C17_01065 [Candidatus Uhrbacteria bacterium RIFCSPHIGHO2_02_FULL_53_13]OGL90065.1 MAG: hypothetical protein A3I45_02865 [Candidatus Uhrbacteria bacterium RIFCSPLOWO2_02_FULL_53_10]